MQFATPPEPVKAPELLQRAAGHMQDRAVTYDKPEGERSMAKTVEVFNAMHGTSLTEAQGWHFMAILKSVRLFTRPGYHADSAEDLIAYAALLSEAKAREPAGGMEGVEVREFMINSAKGSNLFGEMAAALAAERRKRLEKGIPANAEHPNPLTP